MGNCVCDHLQKHSRDRWGSNSFVDLMERARERINVSVHVVNTGNSVRQAQSFKPVTKGSVTKTIR